MLRTDRTEKVGAVDQELRGLRTDEPSALATLYVAPLKRLLELSSNFDELLRDCKQFDRKAWNRIAVRARRVLTEEEERLGLVDRGVQTFLRCVGGSRELFRRAHLRKEERVTASDLVEFYRRRALEQLAFCVLNQYAVYGTDISHFNLSDEEKSEVERYFRTPLKQERRSCRSDQRESNGSSRAATPAAAFQALARALSERDPDVAAVQAALEGLSCGILDRVARLSTASEKRIRDEHKKRREHRRENEHRIRVVLVFESERARLVERACAGIVRCFGGQLRLSVEAAWRRAEECESTKDHRLKKIIDRMVERTLTHDGPPPPYNLAPRSIDDGDELVVPRPREQGY